MTFEQLPSDLFRFGFKTKPSSPIEPLSKDRVDKIADWVSPRLEKSKNILEVPSSYGIKHLVERGMGEYVSNGELIAAMLICGFKYGVSYKNAYFNLDMDKSSFK